MANNQIKAKAKINVQYKPNKEVYEVAINNNCYELSRAEAVELHNKLNVDLKKNPPLFNINEIEEVK
ncbi:hypothetical protein CP985_10350 [Malaciobacter mytili LMG 24559]|uniref:Uncharacterized protein n=1 Tax=Malaciobacter mytili LMG 24559 TaxID=1032238 RepID=A0AAX2AFW8_9BACT|nr:hypothetical protein [Malaciobacter mytili]AXH16436.1 hypothetical protein AMYT_a0138 [Malaciobacter mytili LMG 24559]RXK15096.1 hypothetical protein CP985_10350 [Malaciobacter mytili LMG 24559]